jgi:D-aminoacyl-tRNA deacylase
MRVILQRVSEASVTVSGQVIGQIQKGWLALVGIAPEDTPENANWLADKVANLRAFTDSEDKMNLSVIDVQGSVLVVSNFTLYADCQKGRRPSFIGAARPEVAEPLVQVFCNALKKLGVPVEQGQFGADMRVQLMNDGPVTLIVENSKP